MKVSRFSSPMTIFSLSRGTYPEIYHSLLSNTTADLTLDTGLQNEGQILHFENTKVIRISHLFLEYNFSKVEGRKLTCFFIIRSLSQLDQIQMVSLEEVLQVLCKFCDFLLKKSGGGCWKADTKKGNSNWELLHYRLIQAHFGHLKTLFNL